MAWPPPTSNGPSSTDLRMDLFTSSMCRMGKLLATKFAQAVYCMILTSTDRLYPRMDLCSWITSNRTP